MLVLVLLEGGLRSFGYGYSTDFFQSSEKGDHWVENPRFAWQFYTPQSRLKPHPFLLPKTKGAETIRIFVLGGSAALGTPESAYGFVRVLERMLTLSFPDREFEVVNAAMPGINSHLVRAVAADCGQRDPDLFVVYLGNNELVGLHAPGPEDSVISQSYALIGLSQWVRSSRTGQFLGPLLTFLEPPQPEGEQDMAFFRRHRLPAGGPQRQRVYDYFRSNLESIVASARAGGAQTVLSTVAVNFRECPPLGSLHRADLNESQRSQWEGHFNQGITAEAKGDWEAALGHYRAAEQLDDRYAELAFRMARCAEGAGDGEAAAEAYRRARDLDALPFRADGPLNDVIREVASRFQNQGVRLLDADQQLSAGQEGLVKLPGLETFYEHVHFRFAGDYQMAAALYGEVVDALSARLDIESGAAPAPPSIEACQAALAYNRVNEGLLDSSILDMTSNAPFLDQVDHAAWVQRQKNQLQERYGGLQSEDVAAAFQVYASAMHAFPEDWNLAYLLSRLHFTFHNFDAARENLKRATELMPHVVEVRLGYTRALIETKEFDLAFRQIEVLQRLAPDSAEVAAALSTAKSRQAANR